MNNRIRVIIVIYLFLSVASYFIYNYEITNANELLIEYLLSNYNGNVLLTYILLAFFIINILSCIIILFSLNWVKYIFIITAVIPHLMHVFSGYLIVGPYGAILDSLRMILTGYLIAILIGNNSDA